MTALRVASSDGKAVGVVPPALNSDATVPRKTAVARPLRRAAILRRDPRKILRSLWTCLRCSDGEIGLFIFRAAHGGGVRAALPRASGAGGWRTSRFVGSATFERAAQRRGSLQAVH